jgi:hypothetical protein
MRLLDGQRQPKLKKQTAVSSKKKEEASQSTAGTDVGFTRVNEADRQAVEDYSARLPSKQRKIVSSLVQLVWESAPESKLSIKWAQPVFEQNGPFAYIRAFKDHVNLGFWRGAALTSGKNMLETSGMKMAHIKIRSESEIPKEKVKEWVKEAVRLNENHGDPTKTRV